MELFTAIEKPKIRLASREDMRAILEATLAEGAEMIAPTHVLTQGERVVGYGSAGKVGVIGGWTSASVDDETSKAALKAMENAAERAGVDVLVVACTEDCRFKPFMEQAGYTMGAKQVTMYFKKAR